MSLKHRLVLYFFLMLATILFAYEVM